MYAWFVDLFEQSQFSPHGFCLAWDPKIFWTHLASDALIALSYFSIPAVIAMFALKRRHERGEGVLILFALFIVSCGITHMFGVWNLWHAHYATEAIVKVVTATVSVLTAITLWRLLPHALSIPSASELEAEIAVRRVAEEELRNLNSILEKRVLARTQELQDANQQLERALVSTENELTSKSTFLTSMSHELRTPLNAIIGFSQLILTLDRGQLSDKQKEYLGDIANSGNNMHEMMSDLLELSAIEKGHIKCERDDFSILTLYGELEAELSALFVMTNRRFVPSYVGRSDAIIHSDAQRIKQVIRNFTTNAIKYNRNHGVVSFQVDINQDERVVMSVSDQGQGLTDEEIDKMFQPFERLGQVAIEGTGVGLTISKIFCEVLDIDIKVKSEVGEGSTFSISIPSKSLIPFS